MIHEDTRPDEKPITKPPGRWRNWWLVSESMGPAECSLCGADLPPMPIGTAYPHHDCQPPHPSKDVAETAAAPDTDWGDPYLGAFPEGERP